jgi:hypothetical protein
MDASAIKDSGYRSADARRRRAVLARILRMGVSDGGKESPRDTATMSELETELALLREENAQLKVERHRPADVGHVIERMRSLQPQVPPACEDGEPAQAADSPQAIAECLTVRDGLIEACHEVQQAMRGIRGRLGALESEIHGRVEERVKPDRLAESVVDTAGAESGVATESSSELAESLA